VTLRAPLGRRAAPVVVMAVGTAIAVVGALMPWIRTGGRSRNSFDLFRIVGDLGFARHGAAATAIRWWPVVPLLAVIAVVGAWWGWARLGGAVGVVAAGYTLAVGIAVLGAPTRGRVVARSLGATVTTFGGVVLLAGSVAVLIVGVGSRPAVTPPTDPVAPGRPSAPPRGRS
jgi:hypothetical protein